MSEQIKPNTPYPGNPMMMPQYMPLVIPDPSIRGESWDQLLQNRGIRFLHTRCLPCPNMLSLEDNSHNPVCPLCDGQGLLPYETKEIFGVVVSNSNDKNYEMMGYWELGNAVVSMPTEYSDGKQADFQSFDKLTAPDFTVRMWEMKTYKAGLPSNKQYMRYPIVNTDMVCAAINDVLTIYTSPTHFTVSGDGAIQWVSPPPIGAVYAVQYYANPVYVVVNLLKELRVSQQLNNGIKESKRLPQEMVVKRDYLVNPPSKANT